jgi:hypothetical protein
MNGHLPISSPAVLAPFAPLNAGLAYAEQVKPFGFLTLGHVDRLAVLPDGLARGDVTPLAPFATDSIALLDGPWHNRRDGRLLRVTTDGQHPGTVRLHTVGDVVIDYRLHPETKSGDPRGGLGRRGSVGVLPRLTVRARGCPSTSGRRATASKRSRTGSCRTRARSTSSTATSGGNGGRHCRRCGACARIEDGSTWPGSQAFRSVRCGTR